MIHELRIWSNDQSVGVIGFDDTDGTFSLEYDPEWVQNNGFPLSPRLSPEAIEQGKGGPVEIRRFLENLLPEGQALDDVAAVSQLSKSNLFGLIRVLGRESAGALALLPDDLPRERLPSSKREITLDELSNRIREREQVSFSIWDGRVRMSIAGYQDKIAVFRDKDGRLFLVEGELASTYILKPAPRNPVVKHLVLNEFFCMTLARQVKLDVAKVELMRVPEPVLLIERFDRRLSKNSTSVERIHIIDACQALGLPPAYKYERNFGNGEDVKHIRDGASLKRVFELTKLSDRKSSETIKLLRWTLFQYLVGNTDAHGKNISYFVDENEIRLAPAYDVICVEAHDCFEQSIAMAIGDTFKYADLRAYDWAEFGVTCGIPRKLLAREMTRMAKAVSSALSSVVDRIPCIDDDESAYVRRVAGIVTERVKQLESDAKSAPQVSNTLLSEDWKP